MMITGRLFFASGYFANIVVNLEVLAHWFFNKELALAFTIYMSSSRLGTIAAFSTIGKMAESVGLQSTLWITFSIGMIGPICAILAGWIYSRNASVSVYKAMICEQNTVGTFSFSDIRDLGRDFWILCGVIFFYYGSLLSFLIDGKKRNSII